jgi:hypothetical protein
MKTKNLIRLVCAITAGVMLLPMVACEFEIDMENTSESVAETVTETDTDTESETET